MDKSLELKALSGSQLARTFMKFFRRTTCRRVKGTEPRLAAPQRQGILPGPPPTHLKNNVPGR
jgi:hypothetical protein